MPFPNNLSDLITLIKLMHEIKNSFLKKALFTKKTLSFNRIVNL